MRRRLPLTLSAAALVTFTTSTPAAEVVSISSYGSDGAQTYYQVTCADNTTGSITVQEDPPQVCATPAHGEARCAVSWPVRLAALHACK